jgi:putative transposase
LEQGIDTQIVKREELDPSYRDSRNGHKDKTLRSSYGEIPIQVLQDRNSDFETKVVPKYQRDISQIERNRTNRTAL